MKNNYFLPTLQLTIFDYLFFNVDKLPKKERIKKKYFVICWVLVLKIFFYYISVSFIFQYKFNLFLVTALYEKKTKLKS